MEVLGQPDVLGSSESVWGTARVLVKGGPDRPNLVVNEYLANRLAIALGVPVPLGDVWFGHPDGHPRWVVAAVQAGSVDVPPATPAALARVPAGLRARMLCFDALILNLDRHEENVLLLGRRAWLIDHEDAFFGSMDRAAREDGLLSTKSRPHRDTSGMWLTQVRPGAASVKKAARAMRALSVEAVDGAARHLESHRLISAGERRAALEFVSHRRDRIEKLLDPATYDRGIGGPRKGDLFSEGGEDS